MMQTSSLLFCFRRESEKAVGADRVLMGLGDDGEGETGLLSGDGRGIEFLRPALELE